MMGEHGWAAFLGEHAAEETPTERAARRSLRTEEREELSEQRSEAERAAAAADARDARLMRYAQMGISGWSVGEVFSDASGAADEDAEYEAARSVIEKIDRRRERRAEAARAQAEIVEQVAARSESPHDLLRDAKKTLAAMKVDAVLRQAAAGQAPRASRPKELSRGGAAVRSEHCIHCINQGVTDEESYLLHSDPEYAVPVTSPEQAAKAARYAQDYDQRGRQLQGGGTEMTRVTAGGASVPMIYR